MSRLPRACRAFTGAGFGKFLLSHSALKVRPFGLHRLDSYFPYIPRFAAEPYRGVWPPCARTGRGDRWSVSVTGIGAGRPGGPADAWKDGRVEHAAYVICVYASAASCLTRWQSPSRGRPIPLGESWPTCTSTGWRCRTRTATCRIVGMLLASRFRDGSFGWVLSTTPG